VIVNPKHPRIREVLTEKFTKAIQRMNRGKKFSLKVSKGLLIMFLE